jgi:prolyl-tRNA synthetase
MSINKIEIKYNKDSQFNEWYGNVVFDTELLAHYDVSGCYVFLPYSYDIWELIKSFLSRKFKLENVKDVYFPTLITDTNLKREVSHIEGFTPEVVWVSKRDDDTSEVKLAVRPTSECAFYPIYADKIKSHMDLPLKWNQWCSVMRWEFSSPTPFIRSREFLWQEGHNAFSTCVEAVKDAENMLEVYRQAYENLLCVPVYTGYKIDSERFAGADKTYSIETFIPSAGKGVQCATSHYLGQRFSKMFNIRFQTKDGSTDNVYQTSWGFTTRSIGVAIMTHGDNKGLVLPPTIAPIQIVIVQITNKTTDMDSLKHYTNYINEILGEWRVHIDDSDRTPGWKYNYWEAKGIPIRIEIGKKDIEKKSVMVVRRDTGEKISVPLSDLVEFIKKLMFDMCTNLYESAKKNMDDNTIVLYDRDEASCANRDFKKMYIAKVCKNNKCEESVKDLGLGKVMCRPFGTLDKFDRDRTSMCIICNAVTDDLGECLIGKTF